MTGNVERQPLCSTYKEFNMARPRIRLLIPNDPHPMRIERDLAKEIGLNESIVLLQLEYLIGISNNERDGRLWTYQTLQDLHTIYFPWWSIATISRIVKTLEEKELITIGNFNKLGYDRTQWFALNDVGIARLTSVLMQSDAISQNEKWTFQNAKSILQNDQMDHVKLQNGLDQNETTIPKSTQKSTQGVESAKRAPRTPPTEKQTNLDSFNQAVLIYKELSGKKYITPALTSLIVNSVTDMALWRTVIENWDGCGYNIGSVKDMLDWYDNPEKMAARLAKNSGPRPSNGYTNGQRPAADLPLFQADPARINQTPEERTAAAARRRAILEETRSAGK